MRNALLARVATAVLLAAAGPADAAEAWSRFRGPDGGGVADARFPATWTNEDYAWRITLPGKGHSSPVAWGELVFVASGEEATGGVVLSAIDAATGRERWSQTFPSAPHSLHAANSYASSTPAVDAERVYMVWAGVDGLEAAALDHRGGEVWRRNLGAIDYKHGYGGSPIVVGDVLIVANDHTGEGFVTALDARSGEPRWRAPRAGGVESYATPAVWRAADGSTQIVVHSTAEGMAGLSLADGAVAWQLRELFPVRCVGSPVVAGELVFGGSGEGGNGKSFAAVRPPAAAGEPATVAYTLTKSLPQVPTPVVRGELLFVWSDQGVVSCYDRATGAAHWTKRVGGKFFGSPIIAGDTLYAVSAEGEVVALAAAEEYALLGRTALGEASHATPMVHDGAMYLRTETALVRLPAAEESP